MGHSGEREDLLLRLLQDASGPLSGEHLGAQVGVSARTVRHYISALNRRWREPVIEASHHGYELNDELLARLESEVAAPSARGALAPNGPAARVGWILEKLLIDGDTGDVFALADHLFVSPPTLEVDLGRLRRQLVTDGLHLRRDHDRLSVVGSEEAKRRVLCSRMVRHASRGFEGAEHAASALQVTRVHHLVSTYLLDAALRANGYAINDLAVFVAVSLLRARLGKRLPAQQDGSQRPASADGLADLVSREFGVRLDAADRDAIGALLRATAADLGDPVDARVAEIVTAALASIAGQYCVSPAPGSPSAGLVRHVQQLRLRAEAGILVHNDLSASFKESQPMLNELAVQFARQLEQALGITVNESELGFLAFYLAGHFQARSEVEQPVTVQCVLPPYSPLAESFQEAVAAALGDHAVLGPPVVEGELSAPEADVVVTCVPELTARVGRVVRMGSLPTAEDLAALGDAVRAIAGRRTRERLWQTLSTLLSPRHFFYDPPWQERETLVAELTESLFHDGLVPDWFARDVAERERLSATAFYNQFAIPHGLHMGAHQTAIAVVVSPRPLAWGDQRVQLVMLFALAESQRALFRDVLDALIGVLSSRRATARLIAAGRTYDEFVAELKTLLMPGELGEER